MHGRDVEDRGVGVAKVPVHLDHDAHLAERAAGVGRMAQRDVVAAADGVLWPTAQDDLVMTVGSWMVVGRTGERFLWSIDGPGSGGVGPRVGWGGGRDG